MAHPAASSQPHIALNAVANTGAGSFNVARQLAQHLPPLRPDWRFTLMLVGGLPMHDQITDDSLPTNVSVYRAPIEAAHRFKRMKFERFFWPEFVRQQNVSASLQLNGFLLPGIELPVLVHEQDPWPYLPAAWDLGLKDRLLAFLRRQGHRKALKRANFIGFTSNYLRSLMTDFFGIQPEASAVFYNGLPQSWIDRASDISRNIPLDKRPMELITVSGVGKYKRQELVIRAIPELICKPGLSDLIYRIIGGISPAEYEQHLRKLASDLGVKERVIIEGRVSDERVEEACGNARCFVLMSVAESFGIPAIEAMSLGTPVVTSNCCAMPEVCGDAAILSPVDDLPALVNNLHRVLTDAALANDLCEKGARNCHRFQWNQTAAQMAEALGRIARV